MLSSLFSSPLAFIIISLSLLIAITIHEFAHAFIADKLGDPTARLQGRVTLNPIKHLDPLGSLMLLFVGFGWGKPVPFDPFNLRHQKRDSALIALAGPASNLILATLLSLVLKSSPISIFTPLLALTIRMNINLAIFNLLPIPPLDGSKILYGLLPIEWADEYNDFMQSYGQILLILLILPIGGSSLAISLIMPVINLITNLLL
ncbi:MAG: site-2 protease family protein [Patescibacteria group bacterium]|nr:site-2 protease family protein [Patescibacteria group bacterium]